jgi:hypothetical protein
MYTETEYEAFVKRMEETYPKMFTTQYGGFAVSQGWWPILEKLCNNIQHHIDWKNKQRERELVRHAAYTNGYEALLKFYQGKSAEPSEWDEQNTRVTMEEGVEVPDEVPQVEVHQIKEKFGGLRFYYGGGDAEISGMVRMAESWADVACEECGAIGKRRDGGWIRTLCDTHEAEYQERKNAKQ